MCWEGMVILPGRGVLQTFCFFINRVTCAIQSNNHKGIMQSSVKIREAIGTKTKKRWAKMDFSQH